jgi:hypothetical protein
MMSIIIERITAVQYAKYLTGESSYNTDKGIISIKLIKHIGRADMRGARSGGGDAVLQLSAMFQVETYSKACIIRSQLSSSS